MINERFVKKYCCEDISKIENYELAINDKTQTWECHHRAEVLPCGRFSRNDLKKFNLYYARPAIELIFLTSFEHRKLHRKGIKRSDETKQKISKARKGIKLSEETKRKIAESQKGKRNSMFGKKHSDETRKKISESQKGKRNSMFGKIHSDETKRKVSEAIKLYWQRKKAEK